MKIGSLETGGNLFLAPVSGYTDRAFRGLCAEAGASLCFTELISAEALVRGFASEVMIKRGAGEKRYAIQLFGADPETMGRACRLLAPYRPDAVDLNAGCPVPKVVKHGAGAALMRSPATLGAIVRQMAKASAERLGGIPVTIKMRSGWDSSSINYVECARIAAEEGAAMATLHPRTRAQGYGGRSDWPQIADLAGRLGIPVCGSGDLFAPEDAGRMLAETGCAAAMFARGALGNPFIFASAREFLETGRYEPPSFGARLGAGLRHLELLAADIGEKSACLEMRKQFCAYTRGAPGQPGMPGAAALRQKIVHAETVAQYRDILGAFLAPPLVEANA